MNNPDNSSHQHHSPRERSIPITTTQGNMPTTTHFPLSSSPSSASSHLGGTSSGPFSGSPGRGNLFDKLNQFRKNQHHDEMFSDHFSPFGSMSSASRNVGDFFNRNVHRDRDEEEESEHESHQPRVYNIPIQVETPEGVVPLARSNSHSSSSSNILYRNNNHSHHAAPSHGGGPIIPERTGETFTTTTSTRQRPGPSPTPPPKPRFTPSYKPEPQGYVHQQQQHQQYQPDAHQQTHQQQHRVRTIPVQIEKTYKPSESVSNQSNYRQDVPNVNRESPRPESQQSGYGGPHVINIPINNERSQSSENKGQQQLPPQPAPNQSKVNSEPQKGPIDPLDLIKSIKDEAFRLESEVNKFDGASQKQYRYLDEMLTRCMLKLDNIDSGGRDEVRSARKTTLAYVDRIVAILEDKFNRSNSNETKEEVPETIESNMEQQQSCETSSSMEAETGEIDSTSQQQQEQQQQQQQQQPESIDENIIETNESGEPKNTGNVVDNNEMEVESGSGQSNETTITDQPDGGVGEEAIEEEEEAEEEDQSGVDGSSKDFYNCSNNQLSNENICRTTEAVIIEEMDKEEPPEEPPIKVNRSSETSDDEKVNIETNPMLKRQFQDDDDGGGGGGGYQRDASNGMEIINSSEPQIESPTDDSMSSDESIDTLKPNKMPILMESDSSSSDEIVNSQPFIEMPDENSVSSKDSDENRESIQIVEDSSNNSITNNIQSSPPKPEPVHS